MKSDQSSVNVGLTKSHNRKKYNRMRLPKYSNVPLSATKVATQNGCKFFAIGTHVKPLGLNNMEFKVKVGVIESPLELSGLQDFTLYSPPLQ